MSGKLEVIPVEPGLSMDQVFDILDHPSQTIDLGQ
jgi:hypothetical protein